MSDEPKWLPVADDRLAMIIAYTARNNPIGIWSAADVYALACEVRDRRKASRNLRKRKVSVPVRPVPYEEDAESTIGGDPISHPGG